jgi:TolB protein
MKRNLLILVCLSFVTFSLVSAVVFCETNLPVKITDLDGYVGWLSITDDGSKVAFIAYLQYAREMDGSTRLDYTSAEIFVVNSDGLDLKQVTDSTVQGFVPTDFCYITGDGSKIVFQAVINATSEHPGSQSEIFVVNSDGSELKQVTNISSAAVPSISDDGSKVAFIAKTNEYKDLFVINSDGTELNQLTSNTLEAISVQISGDGSKIVFSQAKRSEPPDLFVINSDGTELKQLTSGSIVESFPSISDDGSKIAYISALDFHGELFVINSDGSGLQQLTDKKLNFSTAYSSISGDGSRIVVKSRVDNESEHRLFVVNSDGSGWHQFETNDVIGGVASLSRDGSKIAFLEEQNNGLPEIFVVSYDGSSTEPAPDIDYLVALVLGVVTIVVVVIVLRRKKLHTN